MLLLLTENEIDGEALLVLSNEDIKDLVKSVGPRVKLLKKRCQLMEQIASETGQPAKTSTPTSQV